MSTRTDAVARILTAFDAASTERVNTAHAETMAEAVLALRALGVNSADLEAATASLGWVGLTDTTATRHMKRTAELVAASRVNWPRRLVSCVEQWPGAVEGEYDPRCCRFPKSCSCTVYDEARVADADLEDPP